MDLIKSGDSKYHEYEELLCERDQLEKEAGQIWIVYLKLFGKLKTDNYEKMIECIKCKKLIAYYQAIRNRGGIVDPRDEEEFLKKEMAEYYSNLKKMLRETDEAQKAGTSSAYEVKRSKELYRRLVKLIHPDINPATDRDEDLKELWQRIVTAYHMNDVKSLSELEVLVRKALKVQGFEDIKVEIPDIGEKIEELREEIERIKSTEPYTLKYLVEDEEAVKEKKKELTEEGLSYTDYHNQLKEVLVNLMSDGGLRFYGG